MKIYIAATYGRRLEVMGIAIRLADWGHEITSEDWHHQTDEQKQQEYEEWQRGRRWDDDEPVSFDQWCARRDLEGVRDADMLVFVTDVDTPYQSTGGRHLELGYALGLGGKYICLIGEPENIFHSMRSIQIFPTWKDFFEALPIYDHAHRTTWRLRKDALRSGA